MCSLQSRPLQCHFFFGLIFDSLVTCFHSPRFFQIHKIQKRPQENLDQDDFLSADPRLGIGKNQRLSLRGFDSDCGRTIEADLLHKDCEHGTETETSLRLEH